MNRGLDTSNQPGVQDADSALPDDEGEHPRIHQVSEDEIKTILKEHRKWLLSNGEEGQRAKLSNAAIQYANLSRADLSKAVLWKVLLWDVNLQGAVFWKSKLHKVSFRNADLRGADLRRAVFKKCSFLDSVRLQETNLQDADLSDANGLLSQHLAGANVAGAKLPDDIAEFQGLHQVEEISRNARKIFLAMLLGCVYSWLTIATTTDARLLTNSASSPLPIIQTEIPIAGFYWAAPVILLSVYFYLHLYLLGLWRALATLPAVFPDGKALDERAYPWLLNGLVRAHFRRLKDKRPALSRFQNFVSIILAWWAVPLTLVLFWGRYLPRHEWFGTGLNIAVLAISTGFGLLSYWLARATLRGSETQTLRWKKPWLEARTYRTAAVLGLGIGMGVVLWGLSNLSINPPRPPGTVFPAISLKFAVSVIGMSTRAHLRAADLSIKPDNWTGKEEDIPLVKGANLRKRNLRYADAERAFLVRADLGQANLQGASLRGAKLQGANLWLADLKGADLSNANLQGATLYGGVKLQGANLTGANLRGTGLNNAFLQRALLKHANLTGANLTGANLTGANLTGANLQGADLRRTHDLTQGQLDQACGDENTKLPKGLTIKPCPE